MKKTFPWTLAFLSALLVGQVRAGDDDDKKKSEKRVVEVVTVHDEHGDDEHGNDEHGDDHDKKRVVEGKHVIVLRGEGVEAEKMIADLEKQLENSKLDTETRNKILAQVRKAMKKEMDSKAQTLQVEVDAHGEGHGENKVTVQTNGKVVMVDESGKKHEFELKSGKPMVWTPSSSGEHMDLNMVHVDPLHMQKLHEEIVKQLKENGVDQSVIEKITKNLHKQMGDHMGAMAAVGSPQYRLGIALEENEDGKLVVNAVTDDSPAAKGGVKEGDVIVSVNGDEVNELSTLIDTVQKAGKKDKSVQLKVMRGDDTVEMELTPQKSDSVMAEMPADLRDVIGKLPHGVQGGFVVPGMPLQGFQEFKGFALPTSEMAELKNELESLKAELGEIKAMLKEFKDHK